jgi:hypothetical protein
MLQPGGRWRVFGRRALFPDKGKFSSHRKGHRDPLMRASVIASAIPARHQTSGRPASIAKGPHSCGRWKPFDPASKRRGGVLKERQLHGGALR